MRFDEDRDGSVTYAELIELMKYLKIDTKKSAALSILDDIDLNGKDFVKISITLHQIWWQLNCHWSWRNLFKRYLLFDFNQGPELQCLLKVKQYYHCDLQKN